MNAQKFTQKSLEAIQDSQNLAVQHNSMSRNICSPPCLSRTTA